MLWCKGGKLEILGFEADWDRGDARGVGGRRGASEVSGWLGWSWNCGVGSWERERERGRGRGTGEECGFVDVFVCAFVGSFGGRCLVSTVRIFCNGALTLYCAAKAHLGDGSRL